ncbi:MAG: AAA family ATPase [Kiritimatiellales bacterium]|nr:AAA family ATPase [Kiritimatiellota bacterium]MBL7012277.1 AAA family ATPase [Kiritimatiellales bacterium]
MRDKPEDDLGVETPATNQPEQASPGEKTPASSEAQESAPTQPEYRVKDQFANLDTIPPTLDRPHSTRAQTPATEAALPEANRSAHSIRHEISVQDFFRDLDFIKIIRGVYRRLWLVLLCACGLMLLFLPIARGLKGGVSYSAESAIIYNESAKKQIDARGSSFLLRPLSQDTLVDMLLSPVNIRKLEGFTGFKPLKNSVSFDAQSKSDIMTLQIRDMPDEQTAINAANKLAEIIIDDNANYYRDLAATAYQQFRTQREAAEQELAVAIEAVEAFQLENQLLEISTQWNNFFSSQAALLERMSISKVTHEGLLTRINEYVKKISTLPDEVLDEAQEDNPLKRRISNAEAALLQARIQYAADNPKVQRQEREIEELRNMLQSGSFDATRERTYVKNPLKSQMEGELLKLRIEEEVVRGQIRNMEEELAALDGKFEDMPRLEKEYAALLETRARLDATYKTLKAGEESARMTSESNLSDFRLLNPASSAEKEDSSLLGKIVPLLGFVFGFFGGLLLVLIIELLDAKIRTEQQLEKAYSAPRLASIVEIPNLEQYDAYTLLLPSLREIAERLDVLLSGKKAKSFGLLSSLDGEGKSTLSFNLARYYSSLGSKVLLVSFDTQPNPHLPDMTDIGWPQMGIEDYLRDKAQLPEMISNINGVDVIRVQKSSADLFDLIKTPAMKRLWNLLQEQYDLIITDIPAVLDHPMAGTVGAFQDELIYVLASPVSDRKLVDAGLEFMEDRGLVPCALIFNRVNPYYLEDIRQQRTIRHLADHRSPLSSLFDRFRKPADAPQEFAAKRTSLPANDDEANPASGTPAKGGDHTGLEELTAEEEESFNQWLKDSKAKAKPSAEEPPDDEK